MQEAERESRDDAKCVLPVDATLRKRDRYALAQSFLARQIRKINLRLEHRGRGVRFFRHDGFDGQRKRRHGQLFIFQFNGGPFRLACKNMLGHFEIKLDAGETDGGENTGHQDDGDQTGEDQKKEIVAGVERGESDEQRAENVDPAGAGDLVLHLVADPAERRALGERRDEGHGDPGSDGERQQRTSSGQEHVAKFGRDARVKRKNKRDAQSDHGKEKRADGGPVGFRPKLRESGWMSHGKLQRNTDGIDDFA